jgi:hypothetical protein
VRHDGLALNSNWIALNHELLSTFHGTQSPPTHSCGLSSSVLRRSRHDADRSSQAADKAVSPLPALPGTLCIQAFRRGWNAASLAILRTHPSAVVLFWFSPRGLKGGADDPTRLTDMPGRTAPCPASERLDHSWCQRPIAGRLFSATRYRGSSSAPLPRWAVRHSSISPPRSLQ